MSDALAVNQVIERLKNAQIDILEARLDAFACEAKLGIDGLPLGDLENLSDLVKECIDEIEEIRRGIVE